MLLNELIVACNFRVSGGSEFLWNCYGPRARLLDFDGAYKGGVEVVSCVFDPKTQQVYEVTICLSGDGEETACYRWIEPEFRDAHQKEVKRRRQESIPLEGDIPWVELDMAEDVLKKAQSIIETGTCDRRVLVPVDLSEKDQFHLMKLAHERDITLNQLVEDVLEDAVARAEEAADKPKLTIKQDENRPEKKKAVKKVSGNKPRTKKSKSGK